MGLKFPPPRLRLKKLFFAVNFTNKEKINCWCSSSISPFRCRASQLFIVKHYKYHPVPRYMKNEIDVPSETFLRFTKEEETMDPQS